MHMRGRGDPWAGGIQVGKASHRVSGKGSFDRDLPVSLGKSLLDWLRTGLFKEKDYALEMENCDKTVLPPDKNMHVRRKHLTNIAHHAILTGGGMSERFMVAVLKTAGVPKGIRGFESLFLRQMRMNGRVA